MLFFSGAAATTALLIRPENMCNLACAATLTASRTRTKTGTEERASISGAPEASTVVTVAIVQISQSAAMIATIKNVACHTFHLLLKSN
jgi:hypothetical protein